jgi:hypothetical protein
MMQVIFIACLPDTKFHVNHCGNSQFMKKSFDTTC